MPKLNIWNCSLYSFCQAKWCTQKTTDSFSSASRCISNEPSQSSEAPGRRLNVHCSSVEPDSDTNKHTAQYCIKQMTAVAENRHTHPFTHPFNGPFSGTTRVGRYQKGKTNLDFTEARDSEWLWHQLGHMQVCTSLQTDNHASTSPLSFLQAGCPSCRPTNSVRTLKAAENRQWPEKCASPFCHKYTYG